MQSENPSERHIEAVGLFHENNFWYVLGFCHYRNDYRQFRTDRMLGIKRTPHPFSREHGSLDDHLNKEVNREKVRIKILVDKGVARYIGSSKKHYGFVSEKIKDNKVEMTFMSSDLEHGFPRWYLMFGDYAEILEPESLKHRVRDILEKAISKL